VKQMIIFMAALMLLVQTHIAQANDHPMDMHATHIYGDLHNEMEKSHVDDVSEVFLVKQHIDGYEVSFHVMKPTKGMQYGGNHHSTGVMNGTAVSRPKGEGQDGPTHNFMVRIEKGGKALSDLLVNSKVAHANGKSESKMMMRMGVWYMAGYDLDHGGKHQLMVLFKTADGAKHFGGVIFPDDK